MDDYTRRTREWLDAIYAGPPGVPYMPHSPVHGFDPQGRYIGTYCHLYAVLRALAPYEIGSCLEVGCGEGFLASLIERIFGAKVTGIDLSWRVCRRADEYWQLPCAVAEALHLPFADASFDVVVSINTLEHIADLAGAYAELRRVARAVVLVGLPHASPVNRAESETEPHAHLSMLSRAELQRVFGPGARLSGSLSRLARPFYAVAARDDVSQRPGFEHLARGWRRLAYGAARSVGSAFDPRAIVAHLCRVEEGLSRIAPDLTIETISLEELARVRRRPAPISNQVVLGELLR